MSREIVWSYVEREYKIITEFRLYARGGVTYQ